jgi:tetratricopeptide (TPR) repeat protein
MVGVATVVVAVGRVAVPDKTKWTTSSKIAGLEFERATDARLKLYRKDAVSSLEHALELDPEFVVAKLQLAELLRPEETQRAEHLLEEVFAADVARLRPRERFLVERAIALKQSKYRRAAILKREYFEQNPDDPYIIEIVANEAKLRGDPQTAERLYRRLIEVAPNWVAAYSWLGYLTMTRGDFLEAEGHFTAYRFIAPEQANAHDSLAELYIITGRYDEADLSVEMAVQLRSDFWPAYWHMVQARGMMRDFGSAREAIDRWARVEGAFTQELARAMCAVDIAELDYDRAWRELVTRMSSPCFDREDPEGYVSRAIHRAACHIGEWELAAALEKRVRDVIEVERLRSSLVQKYAALPALLHMEGVRLALQGNLDEAEERFRQADSYLTYRESGAGVFKLKTRLYLAETLLAQAEADKARELLSEVRAVNPVMVAEFEADGRTALNLQPAL